MSLTEEIRKRIKGEQGDVDPLPVISAPMMELTVAEVKELAAINPDHPLSAVRLSSIVGYADTDKVYCEKADIEAMIENKDIEFSETIETDPATGKRQRVRRKKLVPFKDPVSPASPAKPETAPPAKPTAGPPTKGPQP